MFASGNSAADSLASFPGRLNLCSWKHLFTAVHNVFFVMQTFFLVGDLFTQT